MSQAIAEQALRPAYDKASLTALRLPHTEIPIEIGGRQLASKVRTTRCVSRSARISSCRKLLLSGFHIMKTVTLDDAPLRVGEVCRIVGMSRSWVYMSIKRGEFPGPDYRFGKRSVAWSLASIRRWIESSRV